MQVSWDKGFKKNILEKLTVNLIKHKMITREGNSKCDSSATWSD